MRKALAQSKLIDSEDDADDDFPEVVLYVAYGYPRLAAKRKQVENISDYVKLRLLIARTKALNKFNEVWG